MLLPPARTMMLNGHEVESHLAQMLRSGELGPVEFFVRHFPIPLYAVVRGVQDAVLMCSRSNCALAVWIDNLEGTRLERAQAYLAVQWEEEDARTGPPAHPSHASMSDPVSQHIALVEFERSRLGDPMSVYVQFVHGPNEVETVALSSPP